MERLSDGEIVPTLHSYAEFRSAGRIVCMQDQRLDALVSLERGFLARADVTIISSI